ncbi:MAG: LPS-assembly protein LptD [Treponema sp.]|jgi:lipopolysaccharide assembly outer membrane protein LptD (OstA)|nr:LPS-assembly protein LptD [Treponema sp.]
MKNKTLLLICFFSLFVNLIAAQEPPEAEEANNTLTTEQRRIEMEIKTSTLPELAALSRSLGLPESGTREELSRRIRQHYELTETTPVPENQKVITIESAQTSEYFKIEVIDEEYARLRGDVKLNMKDGDNIHTISAQEIIFNRTRNTLTARGGVVYIKTTASDGTIETFRGENITVNIDNWSSVFLDGSSERNLGGEDTGYMFSGRIISRTGEDVTILTDATITNANEEESYWSITASKIWLLPGSDFAIFNAVLKVGELPMLYIPFFFYPVDELLFHPVIGFRSREGAFVQTTTYILGRPKSDTEEQNTILKILGGASGMEQELQGVFLRSTGKKAVSVTEPTLKLLVDHYVNMGTFAGIEFSLPRTGILNEAIGLSLGFGYTRTVSPISSGNYSPYAHTNDGSSDWNHSNFFSIPVPFRYNLHFKSGINMRYGSISWDFPYYSDPYVPRDFSDRSESLDYFELVKQIQEGTFETTSSISPLSAPLWKLNANINPQVSFLNPYVTRASITNLSSTLTFRESIDLAINSNSPTRSFFVPHLYTIYNVSAAISGTPLSIGKQGQRAAAASTADIKNLLEGIGEVISPWEKESAEAQRPASDDILTLPALAQRFELPRTGNIIFNIDYSINPTSSSELQFMSGHGHWATAEDVDWSDVQSIITTVSGTTNINFNLNHSTGLFANTITFSGSGTWRDYTFINDEAPFFSTPQSPSGVPDPARVEEERRKLYGFTRYNSTYLYNGTVRPLLNDEIFGQSNLQYNLGGTLVHSKRYSNGDGPELTPVWGSWAKEDTSDGKDIYGLKNHRISTNISANILNKQQNLTLGLDLPPLDPLISTNATLRFWNSVTNINFRIRRTADDALEKPGEWIYDPINITETITFGKNSFNLSMVIKPEENNDITNLSSSLSLFSSSFITSFSARKTQKSEFILGPASGGWVDYGDPVFQPSELSFTYNKNFPETDIIANLLNFSLFLNSSLKFDLIKHTNSSLNLTLRSTFKINKFLDITLSATSNNSVIMRYFKNVPGMEEYTFMYEGLHDRQYNMFTDLIDSFDFFDESKRQRTGFKMRSFSIGAIHHLGDWEAKLEVDVYPHLNQTNPVLPRWEVTTDISFVVKWTPISELKSDFSYDGKQDRWSIR